MKSNPRSRRTAVVLVGVVLAVPNVARAVDGSHGRRVIDSVAEIDPVARYEMTAGIRADRAVVPSSLRAALNAVYRTVPSFSRQTGLACSACHYQFPQLTPFGRMFKLNGYTLTGLQTIGQPTDSGRRVTLKLSPIPPISAMIVASVTQTKRSQPGASNGTAQFPQELSIFASGAISSKMGAFTQLTYEPDAGSIGIDNVDVRWATHTTLNNRDLVVGATLNNNPTVQDVWNTVPAWSYPFMASSVAPSPLAGTIIDGVLGQQVVGLGVYGMYDNLLYGEVSAYRPAPQGVEGPLDSAATNVNKGVIPYWRAAIQHIGQSTYFMLGTYGLVAQLYPTGVTGQTDRYGDAAIDAQVEHKHADAVWLGRVTFIHEASRLDALASSADPAAERVNEHLSTLRASATYEPGLRFGVTAGFFETSGTRDTLQFAPEPVAGSRTGRPNSSGFIGEIDYNVWQNARLGLQYVAYSRFNGSSSAYDMVGGRRASDNNTLYVSLWTAF